jgi:hypothetical protein
MTVVSVPAGITAMIDDVVVADVRKFNPTVTRSVSPAPVAPAVGVRVAVGDGPELTSFRYSPAAHPVPSGVVSCHQV